MVGTISQHLYPEHIWLCSGLEGRSCYQKIRKQKYFGAFVIRGLSGIFAGYSQPASGKYIGLNQSTSLGIIDNDL